LFERLLELFFHAKSGVFAGILLVGTTGALVTATVSNGVATITITQASASPSTSASASPSASPSTSASQTASPTISVSPNASPTTSPSSAPSSSADANACNTQAHAAADAVKTVNTAFSHFHTDLMHLRTDKKGDAAKNLVDNADTLLGDIRQNAVKAIHATNACAKNDDEEKADKDNDDEDKDEDENDSDDHKSARTGEGNFVVVLFSNLQNLFGTHTVSVNTTTASASPSATTSPSAAPSTSASPSATTGTTGDPKTIADNAVAAMKLVFDNAKTQLDALPTPSPKARQTKSTASHSPDRRGGDHGN